MTKQLVEMESLFKALADSTRLRILGLLLTGEVCVCDIHESLRIPQPKASRHLAYLRRSGLVETRRDGLWIHYRLGKFVDPVMAAIVDAVRHGHTSTPCTAMPSGCRNGPAAACRRQATSPVCRAVRRRGRFQYRWCDDRAPTDTHRNSDAS